ncbi:MAG TPA: PQQ-binding-like beta-propeller repeat protein [Pirellulaceae bacterium]|nr:PQQ-binding-like beta-propeller repeat protein [Pirellulaceae bacterium]
MLLRLTVLFTLFVSWSTPLRAGDWPQILGPQRNGVAQDEVLLNQWPKTGPEIAWRMPAAGGYAGTAIAKGRVILFQRVDDQEQIQAIDLLTGKSLWKANFPATYRGGIDPDLGPRCVPLVHNDKVYVFGAAADLHCVELATGQKVWSRSLADDFDLIASYFGAGSSPIVAGDRLWLNLGARGAGLVALALDTGKTLYQGTDEQASYSSPVAAKLNGKESVIFVTRYNAVAIDAKSGDALFSLPFGKRGPTVNAASPLVFNNRLFLSASYGVGAQMFDVSQMPPKLVWQNDDSMSSQYTTCAQIAGYLYGVDGREDVGGANLRCVDAATGKVQWSEDGFGIAHVIGVGDQLLIVQHDGTLQLASATPRVFKPLAKAVVARGTVRALPALSQGRLVVRTIATGGGGELVCVVVGKRS